MSKADVIDALDDPVEWTSAGVAQAAKTAGWGRKSSRALLEYLVAAICLDGPPARAELLAAIDVIDERVVAALSHPDMSAAEVAAVLRETLGEQRAAEVGRMLAAGTGAAG